MNFQEDQATITLMLYKSSISNAHLAFQHQVSALLASLYDSSVWLNIRNHPVWHDHRESGIRSLLQLQENMKKSIQDHDRKIALKNYDIKCLMKKSLQMQHPHPKRTSWPNREDSTQFLNPWHFEARSMMLCGMRPDFSKPS